MGRRRRPLEGTQLERKIKPNHIVTEILATRALAKKQAVLGVSGTHANSAYRKLSQEKHAGFGEGNVAKSLTNQKLDRFGSSGYINTLIPHESGSLWKLTAALSAARTGGTIDITVFIDDVASPLTMQINDATPLGGMVSAGGVTFPAFAQIDIRITTNGSWAPTSADLQCVLWTTH